MTPCGRFGDRSVSIDCEELEGKKEGSTFTLFSTYGPHAGVVSPGKEGGTDIRRTKVLPICSGASVHPLICWDVLQRLLGKPTRNAGLLRRTGARFTKPCVLLGFSQETL